MLRIITAPEIYVPASEDEILLFLAGGISNTPDWQSWFLSEFSKLNLSLAIYNPRRNTPFNFADPQESEEQIKLEYEHLERANWVIFWFPKETICPITLFELGDYWRKTIAVGTHPEYSRRFDIITQLKLRNKTLKVYDSLGDVLRHVSRIDTIGPKPNYSALNQKTDLLKRLDGKIISDEQYKKLDKFFEELFPVNV